MSKTSVKNIGDLMDALKGGKAELVNISIPAGSGSLAQCMREGKADEPASPSPELKPELFTHSVAGRHAKRERQKGGEGAHTGAKPPPPQQIWHQEEQCAVTHEVSPEVLPPDERGAEVVAREVVAGARCRGKRGRRCQSVMRWTNRCQKATTDWARCTIKRLECLVTRPPAFSTLSRKRWRSQQPPSESSSSFRSILPKLKAKRLSKNVASFSRNSGLDNWTPNA